MKMRSGYSASTVRCWRFDLVAARVVRAAVLAIGNTIPIAVAVHATGHAIAGTVATIYAALSVGNLVSNAAG